MAEPLLEVTDLSVRFETEEGPVHAVDRLSFSLAPAEVLGVVGESGCGKSAACAVARAPPAGHSDDQPAGRSSAASTC